MFSGMRPTDVVTPAAYMVQASNDLLKAARRNEPDVTKLAIANDDAIQKVYESRLRNDNRLERQENEIAYNKKVGRLDDRIGGEIDKINKSGRRMAGLTSLLGTLGTFGVMNQQNIIRKEERAEDAAARKADNAERMELLNKNNNFTSEMSILQEEMEKLQNKIAEQSKPITLENSALPSGEPALKNSSLTGNSKTLADAIAKYESGDLNYEAFNQGGSADGTEIPAGFKSGNYMKEFGTSLTDKTLGEILELQRDPGKSVMSDAEWVNSGKLHAVGRYQFIGPTLKDEVTRMGLPLSTKFTPDVQDQIFLSHLKRVGNISPWVGPMKNYSPAQIRELNSLIPTI